MPEGQSKSKMVPNVEKAFTVEDVSRCLSVSPQTIRKLISKGIVPCIRVGNTVRIPESSYDLLISGKAGSK